MVLKPEPDQLDDASGSNVDDRERIILLAGTQAVRESCEMAMYSGSISCATWHPDQRCESTYRAWRG